MKDCCYKLLRLRWRLFFKIAAIVTLGSCRTMQQSPKYGFTAGWYNGVVFSDTVKRVYVIPTDDVITVFAPTNDVFIDSTQAPRLVFAFDQKPADRSNYSFRQHSLDIDVLTIPIKYRPRVGNLSNQVITSVLNGAVYAGRRTDIYHLQYRQTPFGTQQRSVTHYAFGLGIFTGIGSTVIDPGVTNGYIPYTYEGFIIPTGVGAIVGVNRFGFGLLLGIDNFIDRHSRYWLYRGKSWIGLSLGLSLN